MGSFLSVFENQYSETGRYQFAGRLAGHPDGVYALRFSHEGKFLASGGSSRMDCQWHALMMGTGSDGLRIWQVDDQKEIQTPPRRPKILGQVTAIEWLSIRNNPRTTVCFGTTLGHLTLWRQNSKGSYEELFTQRLGEGKEIMSIEADKPTLDNVHFALGTLCGQVQLWRYDSNGMLSSTFAVSIGNTVPRAVTFSQTTASSKSKVKTVTVFGCFDGQMCVVM